MFKAENKLRGMACISKRKNVAIFNWNIANWNRLPKSKLTTKDEEDQKRRSDWNNQR